VVTHFPEKKEVEVLIHTRPSFLKESVGLKPQSGEMFIANGDTTIPIAKELK